MMPRDKRPPTAGNGEGSENATTVNRCSANSSTTILPKRGRFAAQDVLGDKATGNDSVARPTRRSSSPGGQSEWRMVWAKVFYDALLAHIQPLSDRASASWTRFWCHYLKQGGPVPDNAEVLARVCGRTPKQWSKIRQEWIDQDVVECVDGFLVDRFIQSQIDHFRKRSETNRRNVGERWIKVEDAS